MQRSRFGRFVRLASAAAYLAALTASAGLPLCTAADGHAAYELGDDACCGLHRANVPPPAATCCDSCEPDLPTPALVPAPDCGGCTDVLAPLPGGVPVPVAVFAAAVETPASLADHQSLPGAPAPAPPPPAPSPPALPAVLRC